MPKFRLRSVQPGRATFADITKGEWVSEPYTVLKAAARARLKRDNPFGVRVVRDVDGKPEPLTDEEAKVVSKGDYQWQRDEFLARLQPCRTCGDEMTPEGRRCRRCADSIEDEKTAPWAA